MRNFDQTLYDAIRLSPCKQLDLVLRFSAPFDRSPPPARLAVVENARIIVLPQATEDFDDRRPR